MSYPVAYRTSEARAQRQLSRPAAEPRLPQNIPANDNHRIPRLPANDNIPRLPPGRPSPAQMSRLLRPLLRLSPWLLLAYTLWELYQMYRDNQQLTNTNLNGWTLYCSVPSRPADCIDFCGGHFCSGVIGYTTGWSGGSNGNCGIGGQSGYNPGAFPYGPGVRDAIGWSVRPAGTFAGCVGGPYGVMEQWGVPSGAPDPYGPAIRWPTVWPVPYLPPGRIPPPKIPVPDPVPIPYKVVPQFDPPWPAERGNDPPVPAPDPIPDEEVIPAPPWENERPPERTKERKFRGTVGNRSLRLISEISQAFETLKLGRDIARAIERALPKELRLRGKDAKNPGKVLRNIYDHFDKIDGNKAMDGIMRVAIMNKLGGLADALRGASAKNLRLIKDQIFLQPRF